MIPASLNIRSALEGLSFPPLPAPEGSLLFNLFMQLELAQWLKSGEMEEMQLRQLRAISAHARETVPYYAELFGRVGFPEGGPRSMDEWRSLPLLTRRDVQDAGVSLHSSRTPPAHGKVFVSKTAGSTGEPVEVLRNDMDILMLEATTVRNHAWQRHDYRDKVCVIRAGYPPGPDGDMVNGWGGRLDYLFSTGTSARLSIETDVKIQAEWLLRHDPGFIITYPSNLGALAGHFDEKGLKLPNLKAAMTIGELLHPHQRDLCREVFGVRVSDLYSSQEVGTIAIECPVSGLYHAMSESLLVEVVDEEGKVCGEGETGRVVLSTLHGYSMPLFRYEMRDYAVAGPPCPCGRGLKTLTSIQGRVRNMLITPDGQKRWPRTGFREFRSVAPVRQYQMIQKAIDLIEFRIVADRPLAAPEIQGLCDIAREALHYPFRIEVKVVDELPLGKNGKFEEFLSELEGAR